MTTRAKKLLSKMKGKVQAKPIDDFSGPHGFLSNFHPAPVVYEGQTYPTAEHAYQAAKTLDLERRSWIAEAPTPGEAKGRGRLVDLRRDWDRIKDDVMLDIVRAKFSDAALRQKLRENTADLI